MIYVLGRGGGGLPQFTYTGLSQTIDDGDKTGVLNFSPAVHLISRSWAMQNDVDVFLVGIGDDYINGKLYHDGKEILAITEQTYVDSIEDIVDGRTDFTATDNYDLGSLLMINGGAH